MITQTIEGRARQYINFTFKKSEEEYLCSSPTSTNHKTLHKCPKCHKSMMINKKTKKEWCEYCG